MSECALWERPKTTRRYLQPPRAERIYTLWAEGKLIYGDVYDRGVEDTNSDDWDFYSSLESCGVWLLLGDKQLDYTKVENIVTENGAPIHGLIHRTQGVEICEEGFCNVEKKATCFVRITIQNMEDVRKAETLTLAMCTGKEEEIVYGGANGYMKYEPDIELWKKQKQIWHQDGDCFTDGGRILHIKTDLNMVWDENTGRLYFDVELEPNEVAEITFSLDRGEVKDYCYETEKKKAESFWQEEIARMKNLPERITNDPERLKMIRHLAVLITQCFSVMTDGDCLIPRQGGLHRIMWPTEAMSSLEALGKLGDYDDYIEDTFHTYFDVLWKEDGEIKNIGLYWASVTGAALYSFATYCVDRNREAFYRKYREKAFASLNWIETTRNSTRNQEGLVGGLFPEMRGTDWPQKFQGWTATDSFNLMGLRAFAKAAKYFHDPEAEWAQSIYDDYVGCMRVAFEKCMEKQKDSDELYIPLCPIGDDTFLVEDFYPQLYHGRFIYGGVITDEYNIRRVYHYMKNHGITKNGLYGHMKYRDGNEHIWYVSFPDFYWFKIWEKLGDREKMQEILDAQINYAMTKEYYMIERFQDNEPYFLPWCPNSSANGRTIVMLLSMY